MNLCCVLGIPKFEVKWEMPRSLYVRIRTWGKVSSPQSSQKETWCALWVWFWPPVQIWVSFITHPSLTMTYKSSWIHDFLRCSKGELQRGKNLKSSYLILKAKDFEGGDDQKKKAACTVHWERTAVISYCFKCRSVSENTFFIIFPKRQALVLFV